VYTAPNTMTSGSGPSFAPASPSVTSILFLLGLVAAAALSALVLGVIRSRWRRGSGDTYRTSTTSKFAVQFSFAQ